MRLLSDIDVFGKRVFVRADLDVPLREAQVRNGERETTNAEVETSTRLVNLKPTVDYLLEHRAKQIIIAGHIDRPKKHDPALSTKQLLPTLEKNLGQEITFLEELTGPVSLFPPASARSSSNSNDDQQDQVELRAVGSPSKTATPQILLFENLRFWPGEEANDLEFARQLASMADVYINDALSVSHREHASVVALPSLLPHAVGLHLQEEIEVLSELLKNPKRPFVAIVGGVKIETKVLVIENLAQVADWVIVGGLIAKQQLTIDNSQLTGSPNVKGQMSKVVLASLTPNNNDIDQNSVNKFKSIIATAKTVVWNGPMGVFEEGFEEGTLAVAQTVIDSGAYSVVGGGETTAFLASKNLLSRFSFVSSGGGAMLEFLAGKSLPGLVALE